MSETEALQSDLEIELFNGTVYRQKRWSGDGGRVDEDATDALMGRALNEITFLKKTISTLLDVMEPFAREAVEYSTLFPDETSFAFISDTVDVKTDFTLGDLRKLLSAYEDAKRT